MLEYFENLFEARTCVLFFFFSHEPMARERKESTLFIRCVFDKSSLVSQGIERVIIFAQSVPRLLNGLYKT